MTDLDNKEEFPPRSRLQHWLLIAKSGIVFAPSGISLACAMLAAYFAYTVAHAKSPTDLSQLAISILKSADAPHEMRDWARRVLKIQVDSPMIAGNVTPRS